MGMAWKESWTEVWSEGHGPGRSYCGIAHTEEGFAVDVFHGDTCVASATFCSRLEAEQAANQMRGRYLRPSMPLRLEVTHAADRVAAH